jgi:methylmalonyl-CoA/ethylmalonyl-CoA epimerase
MTSLPALPGLPLDHVAIVVPSIDGARSAYERVTGSSCTPVETLEAQGVRVAFVGTVELLEPLTPENAVGRFLTKRGGAALHHIAYRTADIAKELERLSDAGFELIDAVPRPGARGHRVAFLHPRSTGGVLVELVEISE